jgi:1A family penicillin-binding protein
MSKMFKKLKKIAKVLRLKTIILFGLIVFFIVAGIGVIWVSGFDLPDIESFESRRVAESTKIYDRTGETVLFDVHGDVKRTVVSLDEISDHVKWATIAIEDDNFYNHNGVEISAIARAIYKNFVGGDLFGGQGGSTITQQVIKNELLTTDKRVSRKIKEWVLAPRLEKVLTKDEILYTYLNEVPYGGTIYGVQEAARKFFSKDAIDLTLAESAYLAALPQAPTYYSPYGNNLQQLEWRKNLVLDQMLKNEFITEEEYNNARLEEVEFEKQEEFGVKAPHFVFYIKEQLEEKYGREVVEEGGLKVVTTLDWELQEEAEEIIKEAALSNATQHNAENMSLVATDPNTGQIVVMVGSRDYFDDDIDGNFNIATAKRQPGSSFKPFIYAEAFNKGYRPETVVFDLLTEFSVACANGGDCYAPSNYSGTFSGPISLRNALAQSINVPAVKTFYLAGLQDSLNLAKKMGIESLTDINQYGLTLVLGGGEVRPVDMATAYGVFANGGVRNDSVGILRVEDRNGNILEEFEQESVRVIPEQTAYLISDVLSDNEARTPAFGPNSYLNFPGADVAVKTGTTNNFRDAWTVGYTSGIAAVAWAGNNDNRSMGGAAAASVSAPAWNKFMRVAIQKYPGGNFPEPEEQSNDVKPIIRGDWSSGGVHSILHHVRRNDPLGNRPSNPGNDPQYNLWEAPVRVWASNNSPQINNDSNNNQPSSSNGNGVFIIQSPNNGETLDSIKTETIRFDLNNGEEVRRGTIYVNNTVVDTLRRGDDSVRFTPGRVDGIKEENNILRISITDTAGNIFEDVVSFDVD